MIKPARDTWTISSCIIALALILLPPVQNAASAATYYVAKTGNNANTCAQAQSTATPKLTIASGLTCVRADDTLYIRNGTYAESLSSNAQTFPTGTSWDNAPRIAADAGQTVTILGSVNLPHTYLQYIIFEGLIIDGQGGGDSGISIGSGVTTPHHLQFKNCEIKNFAHLGVIVTGAFHIFTGGSVHHIGNTSTFPRPQWGHYGFYISTTDSVFEHMEIHHTNDFGVHNYKQSGGASRNTYRFNTFHHNALLRPSGSALLMAAGNDNVAYNNIIYSEAGHGIQVGAGTPVTGAKVYNNTIYNGAHPGIQVANATGAEIRNNIVYLNDGGAIDNAGGTGTIQDHNLTIDPLFVNAAAFNFNLQTSSPAIDAGVTLSQVPTDFKNIPRPQGGAYDIGAYEGGGSSDNVPPESPVGLMIR